MIALAIWVAVSPLAGIVVGRLIGAGMVDRERKGKS